MSDMFYKPGDWNAVCFRCGVQFKASELRKTWQGFYACKKDWEPRHPQDFVKAVPDNPSVPWAQPENWAYAGPNICTPPGSTAIPAEATPGCMTPGKTDGALYV